jgi:(1->4)-alpha-D-glucan 1-alpha-D-glucosylmutase
MSSACPTQLLEHRTDGRVKMFTAVRALQARAALREVYEHGAYVPLEISGVRRECVFAFARAGDMASGEHAVTITCVPRMIATLVPDGTAAPLGHAIWADTRIDVPAEMLGGVTALRDAFTGQSIPVTADGASMSIPAAAAFERFPVALLVPNSVASSVSRGSPVPAPPARGE